MTENSSTTEERETARDESDVQRTVFDFGEARIEVSSHDQLYLIKVVGQYTQELCHEIEKAAIRCRGNIGLVFDEIKRDPKQKAATKFDSRTVSALRSVRSRCERKGYQFFLCKPPQALTDALKLFGALDQFEIVDSLDAAPKAEASPTSQRAANRRRGERRKEPQDSELRRRVYSLDVSLERTDQIEKELDSAAECVSRFLPRSAPAAPGYEFAFVYKSCEKVGGDFFDFVPLDETTIGIAIGDVSGHGLDAALVMGISKKLINIRARDDLGNSPATVMSKVNADLHGDLDRKTFVTALYGTLDLTTGMFRFARAGHEYPIAFRPGMKEITLEPPGVALAMVGPKIFDSAIENCALQLLPGDCLLLVTDGLAECRNRKSALYSRERLVFQLRQTDPEALAQDTLDKLVQSILTFSDGAPREDDMTAILIKRVEERSASE